MGERLDEFGDYFKIMIKHKKAEFLCHFKGYDVYILMWNFSSFSVADTDV